MSISPIRRKAEASPERAALAERVASVREACARQISLQAAAAAAGDAVIAARNAVETAAEGVETAKRQAVEFAISSASGQTPAAPVSIRAAKTAADDADDALASALAARDALAEALKEAGNGAGLMLLHTEAVEVIRAETKNQAAALVAEVDAMQRALAAKGAELQSLVDIGVFVKNEWGGLVDTTVSPVTNRLHVPPDLWDGMTAEQATGRAKWAAAIDALMADAGAALPP